MILRGENVKLRTNRRPGEPGRHLVCVHGAGGSGSHWLGVYKPLAKRYGVTLVDLPGHGASGGAPLDSVEAMAAWLRELVAALGIAPRDLVLAGHSMGGAVVQEYLLGGGEAAGLVLVSTGARLRVAPAVLDFLRAAGEGSGWIDAAVPLFYGDDASDEMRRLAREDLAAAPASLFAHDFALCDRWDALDRAAGLALPVLAICGDADRMTPLKYARYFADTLPRAALAVLPGVGHMPMIEAAAETAAAVAAFVDGLDTDSLSTGAPGAGRYPLKEARE